MSSKPSPKHRPTRRRSSLPGALYWLVFIACAGASFGLGFWFTYRYTSDVDVRGPQEAAAPPLVPLATPVPLVTPQPVATPQDLFAVGPDSTPTPFPASTPEPLPPTPVPVAAQQLPVQTPYPEATEQVDEPTPEPTVEDVYRVQVGSYDNREDAESMVQELLNNGIEAVVVYDQSQYHAQIGAYNSRERALAVADEVNAKGYEVTIRH